jgi:hypothetical protein
LLGLVLAIVAVVMLSIETGGLEVDPQDQWCPTLTELPAE